MAYAQSHRFTISLILVLFLLQLGGDLRAAQDQETRQGKLKVEGKSITRLILRREKDGQREEFRRPEPVIELPVGEYRVEEVHLEGGYVCYASRGMVRPVVLVETDEQASLEIGAPLRHVLEVKRQGRCLNMDYTLLGAGGEEYTGKEPGFRVYQGDKELATGKFESG